MGTTSISSLFTGGLPDSSANTQPFNLLADQPDTVQANQAQANRALLNAAAQARFAPDDPPPLKAAGPGEWRQIDGQGGPAWYPPGANIPAEAKPVEEFYRNKDGAWTHLNPNGRSGDTLQQRPAGMSDFAWQGFALVTLDQVPPQFTTEGKSVTIPNAGANGERPIDADVALTYYVQAHFGQDMAGDLVNRMVDEAKAKGVTVDDVKVLSNNGANSQVQVTISAENLVKLRALAPEYQALNARGQQAGADGQRESQRMITDPARVVANAGGNIINGVVNIVPDTLNAPLFPAFSPRNGSEPNFGRAKVGEMYDELANASRDPNATGGPIPRIPLPLPHFDYRSEMMQRDGLGQKIETGVTILGPLAVGGAISPKAPPETLNSLGALPKVEAAAAATVTRATGAVGKLEVQPGRTLSVSEQRFADKMAAEGRNVTARVESTTSGVKNPDFEIDGKIVEFKSVSNITGTNADKLSKGLSGRILDGGSQASRVTLDVTNQVGMTKEIAERGIMRAFGSQNARGVDSIKEVRIYGKGFDFTLRYESPK